MLNLDLEIYTKKYSIEEKGVLEDCFKQIQSYLRETIISKNPTRRLLEYQLGHKEDLKFYLVIDCNKNQVYLETRHYDWPLNYYFIGDKRECQREGNKYTVCGVVIERWPKIKEDLKQAFGNCQSLLEVCGSFSV